MIGSESQAKVERLPGNVVDIPFAGGTVRFVNSNVSRNSPEEMGKKPDALAISTWDISAGYDGSSESWLSTIQQGLAGETSIGRFRSLLERAQKDSIPIFGIDTPLPPPILRQENTREGVALGYSFALLAAAAVSFIVQNPSVTRRDLLRAAVDVPGVFAAAGIYFGSSNLLALSAAVLPKGASANAMDIAGKIRNWQGLGEFSLRFRALAIAHKLHTVLSIMKSRGFEHPVVAAALSGAVASPFREALAMDPNMREQILNVFVEKIAEMGPLYAQTFKGMLQKIPSAVYENEKWNGNVLSSWNTKRFSPRGGFDADGDTV